MASKFRSEPSTAPTSSAEPATSKEPRAKSLPLAPHDTEGATLVPARMVNEILYCERLFYLEWVQGEWAGNVFTADGDRVHKRVDAGKNRLQPKAPEPDTSEEMEDKGKEDKPYQARSVWLSSERLGLTGKLDLVEVEGGKALAVEYKRGKRPDVPEGAYLPERAQLCAHVLLLREHGYDCDEAEIYFAGDRHRTRIAITEELIATTLAAIERAKQLAAERQLPPPLEDSPKCTGCSLNSICLPDEVRFLRAKTLPLRLPDDEPEAVSVRDGATSELIAETLTDATPSGKAQNDATTVRRLTAARADAVPLYVSKQGASVRLDGERLLIYAEGKKQGEARVPNTSHVALFGNVQISTQAIRSLLGRGIQVHFYSYGSFWSGACTGADTNNLEVRRAQHRAADDASTCLALSKRWVHSKIKNCRTLLRRNHASVPAETLNELKFLANKALVAPEQASLLGIEGAAARLYFQSFAGMLTDKTLAGGFDFDGRNRRPPRDRVNALLSFAYSLLTKDWVVACRAAGLEPLLGFYHQPRFGRPSLALDLMEEFRPIVADSVVLNALNNGVVQFDDFLEVAGSVALSDKARRRFIQVYEQRMDQEVTHPLFQYRLGYRRTFEVQARLLGRVLLGEIPDYPIFTTR